jgi:prepilin-type processing-associated H-X9-DG protein
MNTKVSRESTLEILMFRRGRGTRGITLAELLVVIAIVASLLAVFMPAAELANREAKAVVCQSQLRQRGMGLSVFLNELDWPIINQTAGVWDRFWRPYCDRRGTAATCPMARRYETNRNDPYWTVRESKGSGLGSKFTAWMLGARTPMTTESGYLLGSYGMNRDALVYLDAPIHNKRKVQLSCVPIFLDCVSWTAEAFPDDKPPSYDGALGLSGGLKECCIDRHNGAVNCLFLDWSVREVGLKELWTLDWSPWFDPQNAWTRAGGVRPTDWPRWMRTFEEF